MNAIAPQSGSWGSRVGQQRPSLYHESLLDAVFFTNAWLPSQTTHRRVSGERRELMSEALPILHKQRSATNGDVHWARATANPSVSSVLSAVLT